MLIGNKDRFAIEINIDEIYNNHFIGSGSFLVYVNGFCYGVKEEYATYFMCIAGELDEFSNKMINSNLNIDDYSKEDIAKCFYGLRFSDYDLSSYDTDFLEKVRHLKEWAPESAFDDRTHLIHFDDNNKTRIVIFKSCTLNDVYVVKSDTVQEIIIPREEFCDVIRNAIDYMLSEQAKAIKEGRV